MKLGIFLTQKCNLSCKHCLNRCPSDLDMNFDLFLNSLKTINNIEYINITGGEPILHPSFSKIVKYLEEEMIYFSFVSNGVFYKEYAKIMNYKYFDKITFSINGSETNHDFIRGKGSFKKVIEAIECFSNKKKTSINYNIIKQGYEEVEDVINFLSKYQIHELKLGSIITNNVNNDLGLSLDQRAELFWKIVHFSSRYNVCIIPTLSLWSFGNIEFCQNIQTTDKLYLDEIGNLLYCCNIAYPFSILGNIKTESLEKLLHKRDLVTNKIREDRLIKLLNGKLEPIQEYTCEYCNTFFNND